MIAVRALIPVVEATARIIHTHILISLKERLIIFLIFLIKIVVGGLGRLLAEGVFGILTLIRVLRNPGVH